MVFHVGFHRGLMPCLCETNSQICPPPCKTDTCPHWLWRRNPGRPSMICGRRLTTLESLTRRSGINFLCGESTTLEIFGILGVALSLVLCVFRIGTERRLLPRNAFPVESTDMGSVRFLHPVNQCTQQVELIKRWASCTFCCLGKKFQIAAMNLFKCSALNIPAIM